MNHQTKYILQTLLQKDDWIHKIHDSSILAKWKKEFSDLGLHHENFNQSLIMLKEYDLHIISGRDDERRELKLDGDNFDGDIFTETPCKCSCQFKCDHPITKECTWHTECDYHGLKCGHDCNCPLPKKTLFDYVIYNKIIDDTLHDQMKRLITTYTRNGPIDWHPGSERKVRAIVHPSLYPYIRGVSKLDTDMFQEKLDDSLIQYQWLPTDMIYKNDAFQFSSYINNLASSEVDMIRTINILFNKLVPHFSHVLSRDLTKQKTLQVIVKIASIELFEHDIKTELPFKTDIYDGGQYHKEGMSHEHIVATAVHYVQLKNITGSKLSFIKPYPNFSNSSYYPQSGMGYIFRHYDVAKVITESTYSADIIINKQLGDIDCKEGSTVIFPNTLIHKVEPCVLAKNEKAGYRVILAFFLIDPNERIISTGDIKEQQDVIPREVAEHHRDQLMKERGFKLLDNNLNHEELFTFNLCEH
jgi:hypothetical protein